MKRLALVLAAALLGTGCIDNTCDRFVTFDWTGGFRNANGGVVFCGGGGSTSAPPILFVDVWVNGQGPASFACSDLGGTVLVPGGTNTFDVEAVDGSNAIIFRDTFNLSAACGNQGALTMPGEGRVSVNYSLPAPGTCVSPGPSFIWVKVQDDIAGVVAADSATAPEQFTCGSAVSFLLADGNYTLFHTQEMVRDPVVVGAYDVVGRDCTQFPFSVAAALTTTVSPALVDSTVACSP